MEEGPGMEGIFAGNHGKTRYNIDLYFFISRGMGQAHGRNRRKITVFGDENPIVP